MGGRGSSSGGSGGSGGGGGGALFDASGEPTAGLTSKLDAALGEGNWDDQEIGAIKAALADKSVQHIVVTDEAATQGDTSAGIFGGTITKEDGTHIYMTGRNFAYKGKVRDWKLSKVSEKTNYRGDVYQSLKSSKIK